MSYNLYFNTSPQLTMQSGNQNRRRDAIPITHTGLTNDTPYFYAVTAVFEDGTSKANCRMK